MTNLNKALTLILLVFLAISCSKDNEANFTLKGHIKGLKKGVVYLQKNGDSTFIIDLDSMVINGQPEFTLKTEIEEPIVLYLKLYKNDGEEHFIPFFADKGVTEINTTLKNFNYDAQITGSELQKKLDEYTRVQKRYNDQNLDIIKASFIAQRANDSITTDSLSKRSEKILKLKYAHTINFALNNKDSEIAPYLTLYDIPNANPIYIDSVYNNLTDDVKSSFYGKKLGDVIENRKSVE
ncbi:DUF4369 domain-containing protein [uncultured Winogradskyella sp.]|uniref:DUF4369 domain-containing protein n=1 Tax=uncultured Winogradskyella sp. TaxID=395353 RepID=UPI002616D37A|nr:DUF4369 domain-containing protein [uncultured Winogradskyella sp.]